MHIINGLIDRIFFVLGVLLFMQLPNFIDHYEQRLGGYYQAQVQHMQRYQDIADQQYDGQLDALIEAYESQSERSIQLTGQAVRTLKSQVIALENDLNQLDGSSLSTRLAHLVTAFKPDIAQAVLNGYSPALLLSTQALLCGFVGGITLSLLFNLLIAFCKRLLMEKNSSHKKPAARTNARIEPTVMPSAGISQSVAG